MTKITNNFLLLWSLRIGIGMGIFSLFSLFFYYRAYIPKPYIPIDSHVLYLLPICIIVWVVIRRKRKKEEIKGGEKKELGYWLREIILPLYFRIWNNIYKLQNLLFILYPQFFRKLMYISHRFYHEYVFQWGRKEEKNVIYRFLYQSVLGGCAVILFLSSLIVDLFFLHSIHYTFYGIFFSHLYFRILDYSEFLANCYEFIILRKNNI